MKKLIGVFLIVSSYFSSCMSTQLTCVTSKLNKFALFQNMAKNFGVDLVHQNIDLVEIQSDPETIVQHKVKSAWKLFNEPLFVDDSGFSLEAFPKFPCGGTKLTMEAIGLDGLLGFCKIRNNYRVTVYAYIAYVDEAISDSPEIFKGTIHGILQEPSYSLEGLPKRPEFWFDFFIPDGSTKTYGQLFDAGDLEAWNYRVFAFEKFLAWFKENRK